MSPHYVMTSANCLLAEIRSLLLKFDALPGKIQDPEVRPSAQQAAQLEALAPRLCEGAQALQAALASQSPAWTREVRERCDARMAKARAAIQDIRRDVVKWPTLKRNLVVIFQGPQVSAVDTGERKAKKAKMCLALRQAGHAAILAWAVSFPPSSWEEMPQAVFQELVKQMAAESIDELPPKTQTTICALAEEEPLCGIEAYGEFVKCGLLRLSVSSARTNTRVGAEGLATSPSGHATAHDNEALVGEGAAAAERRPQKKRRPDESWDAEATPPATPVHPIVYDEMALAGQCAAAVEAMPWAREASVDLFTGLDLELLPRLCPVTRWLTTMPKSPASI